MISAIHKQLKTIKMIIKEVIEMLLWNSTNPPLNFELQSIYNIRSLTTSLIFGNINYKTLSKKKRKQNNFAPS